MCIHILSYTYRYIQIHTYTYTYTYIYIHLQTYTNIYLHSHTYTIAPTQECISGGVRPPWYTVLWFQQKILRFNRRKITHRSHAVQCCACHEVRHGMWTLLVGDINKSANESFLQCFRSFRPVDWHPLTSHWPEHRGGPLEACASERKYTGAWCEGCGQASALPTGSGATADHSWPATGMKPIWDDLGLQTTTCY